jgi:predicted MFS family arabinose efflux permease
VTVTTLWSFSPDVVQVVLAIAGIGSLIGGWVARRVGHASARRWMMVAMISIAALFGYSLIVTWLFATPPVGR